MDEDEKNEDDFGTRRRNALFGDDPDEDVEDEETKEARVYTEEELKAERKDLLGRKVYTPDSIDSFIAALKDGEEYDEAINTYLKLMPDESEDEDETEAETSEEKELAAEFPTMAEQEDVSEDEFPEMTKEELKKKKKGGTGLDDEFHSME